MSGTFDMPQLWWERDDIGYRNYRLFSGRQDLQVLAESSGTPAYACNAARIQQNLMRLSNAFVQKRIQFKFFLRPQSQSLSSPGFQLETKRSLWCRRMLLKQSGGGGAIEAVPIIL
jgi:hypothetical protein